MATSTALTPGDLEVILQGPYHEDALSGMTEQETLQFEMTLALVALAVAITVGAVYVLLRLRAGRRKKETARQKNPASGQ